LHWVSAAHSLPAVARLYGNLFVNENPYDAPDGDLTRNLNPSSLEVLEGCRIEPSVAGAKPGDVSQFERLGYFCVDPDTTHGRLVFNRTATLKDEWAKIKSSAV